MSHEHPAPRLIRVSEIFQLTEPEARYYRLSDSRFQAIFEDEHTLIHAAGLQGNHYGECLSITLSRVKAAARCALTVYGLGVDRERDVWFTDEWYWYEPHRLDRIVQQHLPKILARELIEARRKRVEHAVHDNPRWFPRIIHNYRLSGS
ncbi:MAG: hypothetical protein KJ064_17775 [Anaerolineae bacterium]|nr:hypothetical protein [Anaerolineae bacterium]